MDNLFDYSDYKKLLRDLVYGGEAEWGTQAQMAKSMGCQASYFSQVLKEKAELTEDHAIKLSGHLKLSPIECDYFILLVRLARAGTPELRTYLEKQRQSLVAANEDAARRLHVNAPEFSDAVMQKYFSSWIPSTLHVATSSGSYQTAKTLAQRFNLSEAKVEEALLLLQSMGFVKSDKKRWQYAGASMHFQKSNRFDTTHQIVRRNQAIRAIEMENPDNFHFSSIFALTVEDYKKLRLETLNYVEKSHKLIRSSGSEEVFGMSIDVFRA